jgi:short-subunit dehydrogenase
VYAATKRALRSYFESLSCMTRGTGVEVQLYELGYVQTQQSFGKRLFPPPVSPARVAATVVAHLGTGSRLTHYPRPWGLAASFLRLVPEGLIHRLDV